MDKLSMENTYRVFVPIEDHDMMKSVEVDENGDYIVQGVMSSDDLDEEGDNIEPGGMDCSYFLQKGWIKYEHGKEPKQFIGEPLEVKVGRFTHPTLQKAVNGIFIKGRLFQQRELAQQAVKAIEDLQKSVTKRRMGWSIEGNVKERCRKTGRVKKSILRNVVLTMNPVNTLTWAELQKSFAPDHELTIDMIDKAMDIASTAAVHRQSLEGHPHEELLDQDEEDNEEEHGKLHATFRKMLAKILGSKNLQKSFITSSKETCELMAYSYAIHEGLGSDEAEELASCVSARHDMLKSLIRTGGERMAGKASDLLSLLDGDLETLQKAMAGDQASEEDEDMEDPDHEEDEDEDQAELS